MSRRFPQKIAKNGDVPALACIYSRARVARCGTVQRALEEKQPCFHLQPLELICGLIRARMDSALEAFRHRYPAYDSTRKLDELRATEYSRLDRLGHVYLDYTGGGLYAESRLRRPYGAAQRWRYFGNPHSKNLTSMAMTRLVEQTREYVLQALQCVA